MVSCLRKKVVLFESWTGTMFCLVEVILCIKSMLFRLPFSGFYILIVLLFGE